MHWWTRNSTGLSSSSWIMVIPTQKLDQEINNFKNNNSQYSLSHNKEKLISSTTGTTWTLNTKQTKNHETHLKKNVRCNNGNERLQLCTYHQSQMTRQLVMKNNPTTTKPSNRTYVVYKFSCPHEDCRPRDVYYLPWWDDYDLTTTSDHAAQKRNWPGWTLGHKASTKAYPQNLKTLTLSLSTMTTIVYSSKNRRYADQGRRHGFLSGGSNRRQGGQPTPKYPKNRTKHWILATSFSNLGGRPTRFSKVQGSGSPPPPDSSVGDAPDILFIAPYKPPLNTQMNTHISLALWGVWVVGMGYVNGVIHNVSTQERATSI